MESLRELEMHVEKNLYFAEWSVFTEELSSMKQLSRLTIDGFRFEKGETCFIQDLLRAVGHQLIFLRLECDSNALYENENEFDKHALRAFKYCSSLKTLFLSGIELEINSIRQWLNHLPSLEFLSLKDASNSDALWTELNAGLLERERKKPKEEKDRSTLKGLCVDITGNNASRRQISNDVLRHLEFFCVYSYGTWGNDDEPLKFIKTLAKEAQQLRALSLPREFEHAVGWLTICTLDKLSNLQWVSLSNVAHKYHINPDFCEHRGTADLSVVSESIDIPTKTLQELKRERTQKWYRVFKKNH